MQPNPYSLPARPKLGEKDFQRISSYIQKNFGIKLPLSKIILVESRLVKRIIKLNIKNFSEYVSYVFSKDGLDEQVELIDFISTNKTDFFREDHHFNFLEKQGLNLQGNKFLKVWSSACSSGEEAYTIAMVLEDLKSRNIGLSYQIHATDISSTVLQKARAGEYHTEKLMAVPGNFRKKYFEPTTNGARVIPDLKRTISFERFNLIDESCYNQLTKSFDIIFCRNVLIYFDQATQGKVVSSLISKLVPGGFLFLGHTETLLGRNFNLLQIQPTIYQKPYA